MRAVTLLGPLCVVALLGGANASAQGLHPMPLGPRPLHLRLATAEVVAVGTIASIGKGRIEVTDAVDLRGEPGERFEIKRAPSAPPPLAIGVRALLPLRGARSPYVLVDDPDEVVVFANAEEEARWIEAVRELLAAGGQPDRIRELYLGWLDGESGPLQQLAGAALLDQRSELTPLAPATARARARVAADPETDPHARRVSALLALGDPSALEILLEATPGDDADARLVELTLRAGAAADSPALPAALNRTLSDPDPEVRRAGLGAAQLAWSPAVADRLAAMQAADPDPRLRRDVARLLARRSGASDPAPGGAERRRSRPTGLGDAGPDDRASAPERGSDGRQ